MVLPLALKVVPLFTSNSVVIVRSPVAVVVISFGLFIILAAVSSGMFIFPEVWSNCIEYKSATADVLTSEPTVIVFSAVFILICSFTVTPSF
ncbi:MAG: hypothetical protein QGG54_02090, partial [Gammaproteobacteria bacterium]|nr:hypothetical protein [Gammaproteobacteria bacterium]